MQRYLTSLGLAAVVAVAGGTALMAAPKGKKAGDCCAASAKPAVTKTAAKASEDCCGFCESDKAKRAVTTAAKAKR